MKSNLIRNVVILVILTVASTFAQPPQPPGGGGGTGGHGTGAPVDCEDVICQPCQTQNEIFVPHECCTRCENAIYDCSNIRCFRPMDVCEAGQVPIPDGLCCPQCL